MKRLTTINVLIALLLSTTSSFSQLVAWQFGKPASVGTETTYNATTNNVNLESSVLKRGSGITGYGLDNGFSSNNWTSTLSTNRYYEFSIQPKTNYKVSLSTLDAKLRCSSYGPKNYIWKYSIDGGNTFIEISGGTLSSTNDTGKDQTQINLSGIAELQNVTAPSTVIFRVYAWNASATSGTFAFGLTPSNTTANCLAIGGTVGPIPVISSFTPTTGAIGTTVTINGKNFNTDKAKNIVFFGATMATVSAASATSLTVIVPKGATYHAISVTDLTTGLTGYSEKPFISTFSCGGFIDATSFATKQEYKTSGAVYGVAIGDLDGDGKPDLAVPNYVSQTVSLFKNTSSSGTVSFASKQDLSTSNPTSVAIGDLDGDGKPELVVGNGLYITVTVFRNTSTSGAVSFAAKQDFTTGSNPHDIAIGDLDGDGKPELVTANYGSNTISVFRNTSSSGTVSFVAKQDFTTGTQPFSVSIGDLDGDGKQDLTVPNSGSTTVSILKNTSSFGMINFADKNDLTTGSYPTHVAIGDLDGDGMPDLAVTNSSSTISVLRNTGSFDAIAFASKQDFTTGSSNQGVAIGDLDGDGKPDLAAVNSHYQINTVSVLRNTGSSGTVSFASKQDFTTGNYPIRVVIGDLDGDGQSDLAVGNYNDASVSVLRNAIPRKPVMSSTSTDVINSGATVNIPLTSNFASTYTWVAADNPNTTGESLSLQTTSTLSNTIVNNSTSVQTVTYTVTPTATGGCGEGIAQIVTVTVNPLPIIASISPSSSSITGGISVVITGVNFTSASNVKFGSSSATSFTVNSDTQITATAPAGSVGTVDITVTTPKGTSTTSSTDRFTYAFPTTISSFSPASGVVGTTVTITGTNFNTDKAKNIVFFGATLATVSAASATSLTVTVPPGATYQAISITDLITGLTAYSAQPFITTFSCGGYIDASSFTTKQDFTTGSNPQSVVIGDIDGDGKPDLVVVNLGHSSSSVSVFRNTSSSSMVSFAAKQDFKTGDYSSPISVSIGDMDGDGKPDLVVANSSSSTVSVFRNTSISGTVSFAAKQDFTTDLNPKSLAIGDMDGDGKPEFAVVNTNLNTVSVFRNTSSSGTVSFAAKQNFSTGDHPFSVVIGDVDGDSKPELAVANWFSSTVSVFRNTSSLGTISFETKQDFTTGTYPQSLAIGDMDGDGKPDLALGTLQSSTVSILRNTSNTGTVHFATNQDFPTGSGPTSVAIGDVDGDGKPDLAVVNNSSQTVSILRNMSNSGTVSFDTKQDFTTTGPWTYCVAIGDVNGDGKPDLAVANHGSNTVSVLKNTVIKKAVMSSTTTAVINSGTKVSIPLTSNFNSTYTWVAADNPNTTGESLTLQTTNTLSNTIVNNSISIQTVTYTVTPTLTDGCGEGIAQIITVTVNPLPSITAISHLSGPTTGGTIVTITGTNLTNATSVKFGSTAATITENTTTSISAIAPAGTAGKVDITITTAGGTSAISSADEFTYITPKTVATAPIIGAATAGNGQATVSFTTPISNGGSTITGYTITSNPGGLTATGSASPVTITGLTNGTAYTFTVTATNSAGTSPASAASNSVTPKTVATAPTIGAATAGNGQATVSFTTPISNGGSTITGYTITSNPGGLTATGSASPVTITGLTNGTAYTFTVTATNSAGTSSASAASNSVTPKTVATVPTIGAATAGNGQATVSFTTPISNGGSTITGYTITSNPGGLTATGSASPVTITGLTNGTAYTFTVTATNSAGTSSASAASNSVTPKTVATVPTIGAATAGNGQATVSFTTPISNGGSTITGYTITSNPGGLTATGSASPVTITGLTNGTAYTFTVTATNSAGTSPASAASNSVTPKTVATAPTIGAATAGNGQATVSFTTPISNGGSTITGYTITSNPGGLTATGSASPVTITGLTNGTAYTFTVTATNSAGTSSASAASNSVTPKTVATVPTIGAATAGNGQATVSFTTPISNGGSTITGYTITSNPGGLTATGSASPVTITGLTNGTAYTFTVTATNSAGTSSASSASNSVTPNAPPTATTSAAADITPLGATLNGTVNANNASTTVTFEYGLTTSYGSSVTAAQSPISGTSATAVSAALTGLEYNTTYYYRVKAENAGGITYGDRLSFKTLEKYIFTISSPTATAIKLTTAKLGATIAPANAPVLERGICWSTTKGVTIDDNKTSAGGNTAGTFTVDVSDFTENSTIYYRGYVITHYNETILSDEANFSNVPVFTGDGDWDEVTKWNVQELPNSHVNHPIINGKCTISNYSTNGLKCGDLTINEGAKLTVNPAQKFIVMGKVTNNAGVDGLVFKANASLPTASFGYVFGAPSATVEMYSKASWDLTETTGSQFNWQYFGIPVKTVPYSSVFQNCIVRRHNETAIVDANLWKMETADSTLTSGSGYEITQAAPTTYTFKGELTNAEFTRTLPYTMGAKYPGQHIFSNPFLCAIKIKKINFGANTNESIYLYNTGTQNNWKEQASFDGNAPGQYTVSTKLTAGIDGIPAQIPSMQGFLIKTTGTATGSFSVDFWDETMEDNKDLQRAPRTNATDEKVITRIDVTSKQSADRMWIFTEPTCTRNFDNGWDGYKMMGSVVNPQLFAMEADGNYQINAVPTINETYLGFQAGQDTDYTLKFTQLNVASTYNKLYLMDLVDGHIVDITADGSEYSFKASSTPQAVKRFKIVADVDNSTGNTEIVNNNLKISHSNETIYIENRSDQRGTCTLYDLKGVAIKINLFDAQKVSLISTRGLIPGVYLIKAGNGIEQVTEKIIIR